MGYSDLKCEHCRNIIKKDETFYMFSEKHDRIYKNFSEYRNMEKNNYLDFYSLCNECGKKVNKYYNGR